MSKINKKFSYREIIKNVFLLSMLGILAIVYFKPELLVKNDNDSLFKGYTKGVAKTLPMGSLLMCETAHKQFQIMITDARNSDQFYVAVYPNAISAMTDDKEYKVYNTIPFLKSFDRQKSQAVFTGQFPLGQVTLSMDYGNKTCEAKIMPGKGTPYIEEGTIKRGIVM